VNPIEPKDLLTTAVPRRQYLEFLEEPRYKRDIIDELATPRSTVDRDVRQLEDIRLVERTTNGYQTTAYGRLVNTALTDLCEALEGIVAAWDIIPGLCRREDPPTALVADPTVFDLTPTNLARPIERIRDLAQDAVVVRCLLPFVDHPTVHLLDDLSAAERASVELVFTDDALNVLISSFPAAIDRLRAAECRLYQCDSLPFGLVLTGGDCSHVSVFTDPAKNKYGLVVNENQRAIAWGEKTYRRYRDDATVIP
jgi:predicted transcriptional regulator